MATVKYTALETIVLESATSSVSFYNISQDYTDLRLVINGSASAGAGLRLRINNDSGTNYSYVYMQGSGSAVSSSGTSSWIDSYIDTSRCLTMHEFLDYSQTDKHKTVLSTRAIAGTDVMRLAQRWASTSPITDFYIYFSNSSVFAIGTTFELYGVK